MWIDIINGWPRFSPGRCIVCDAPACTCTSADYDSSKYPRGTVAVVPLRPGMFAALTDDTPPAPPAAETTFTTKTYRRPKGHSRP
jgi:hypothetical protein